ncbi:hypothetical protein [Massilia sp. CCM 8734]|uniref:hypothetical protein n=1 Tax=Massilia sp. CCM 8734 TaxID=2609283 RepID=UPI00141DB19D|nr:hypothetical protein [Massilia sp. CCM 8734]NHZ96964.1 hypothetical protein [Massilia sp. CCM 8734]
MTDNQVRVLDHALDSTVFTQASALSLRAPVDKRADAIEDRTMTSPSREEVDAKLKTIETKVDGRLAAIELTLESGISSLKTNMDAHSASIDAQFARFEASMHKSQADTVKWVVGIVLILGTIGLAIMTFLFNNVVTKAPAVVPPIVITIPSPPQAIPDNSSSSWTSPTRKESR